jgi:hypothetical protein
MNTLQLGQRLLRRLTIKDMSLLSAEHALEIVDAINGATQKVYHLLPHIYKRRKISGSVLPEYTKDVQATYNSTTTDEVFTFAERGRTIFIGDDSRPNQIVGDDQLLNPFLGSTGTHTATIMGDCLHIAENIERIVTNPMLDTGHQLMPVPNELFARTQQKGRPTHYSIAPAGISQAQTPSFYLRLSHYPQTHYHIAFFADVAPRHMAFADLSEPKPLPIQNDHIESILLPFIFERLTDCNLWEDKSTVEKIKDTAEQAVQMAQLIPPQIEPQQRYVGTPHGY